MTAQPAKWKDVMQSSEIETKAAFDHIRYAQLWEDADVLTEGLADCSGGTLV